MKKYIPNILTIIRILLVPLFIWFVFISTTQNHYVIATILFILACISDYFDGMLARQYRVISNFGKIMDPLADKILVISALAALTFKIEFVSIWVLLIIVIREVAVSILRAYYSKKKIYIAANIWGKLKTVFQMVGIITALTYFSFFQSFRQIFAPHHSTITIIFKIFFWIVGIITIISGITYFKKRNNDA
ncbi:MAG: CDP-diacylglycerol--glycerol-3-phosphate 3-phosphatidyltransferase [Candidatus Cloacimonadota bacterium]|nr:CDP-diacylglycerol--glycerol-3-phosphate 3-phosphatidyltransferase [Candidatus Cloacimonadota bacterium]